MARYRPEVSHVMHCTGLSYKARVNNGGGGGGAVVLALRSSVSRSQQLTSHVVLHVRAIKGELEDTATKDEEGDGDVVSLSEAFLRLSCEQGSTIGALFEKIKSSSSFNGQI